MSYTPVELRHVKVGRSLFGYNRATVEQLIEEVAQSFEATWRERGELSDKLEALEKQVSELRGREHLLTQTLVAAEQAASDVRERARREAETIVEEAHIEARSVGRAAQSERERLYVESKRIEAMLRAALGIVESESMAPAPPAPPAPAPVADQPVPVVVPAPAHVVEHEPEPEPETEPETEPAHEPAAFVPPLPVVVDEEPEPVAESEYGWAREDTREFEPISVEPQPEPETETETEHQIVEHQDPDEQPVLERVPGAGSRDFDWGE